MQILVISDLHRRRSYFEKVLEKYPNINTVFFLGDGADDAADIASFFPDKTVHILSAQKDTHTHTIFLLLNHKKRMKPHPLQQHGWTQRALHSVKSDRETNTV